MVSFKTIINNKRLTDFDECKDAVIATSTAAKKASKLMKHKDELINSTLLNFV